MNLNSLIIRQEKPTDYTQVEQVVEQAFYSAEHSDGNEHQIVHKLRSSDSFIPQLSLVAEIYGNIVGHVLLTSVRIKNQYKDFDSLALAPVSVLPDYQNRGIGGNLIKTAHSKAKQIGFTSVVLLGHENYYPKFGYKAAYQFNITFPFEAPPENCMAVELEEHSLKDVSGVVVYPADFFE